METYDPYWLSREEKKKQLSKWTSSPKFKADLAQALRWIEMYPAETWSGFVDV